MIVTTIINVNMMTIVTITNTCAINIGTIIVITTNITIDIIVTVVITTFPLPLLLLSHTRLHTEFSRVPAGARLYDVCPWRCHL